VLHAVRAGILSIRAVAACDSRAQFAFQARCLAWPAAGSFHHVSLLLNAELLRENLKSG